MRNIIARQYGAIIIERGICSACGDPCIICFDDTSSCCSAPVSRFKSGIVVKETQGILKRKRPNKATKEAILEKQDNKCFWCGRSFGSYIISPKNIVYKLSPVWDHYIPYSLTGDNTGFVASCSRCNLHKSAFIITSKTSEQELRTRLIKNWYRGGWKDMEDLHEQTGCIRGDGRTDSEVPCSGRIGEGNRDNGKESIRGMAEKKGGEVSQSRAPEARGEVTATRLVLDLPDEFYARIGKQLPVVKPEFVKGWIFDTLNKALNNTEARQRKTAAKGAT